MNKFNEVVGAKSASNFSKAWSFAKETLRGVASILMNKFNEVIGAKSASNFSKAWSFAKETRPT